jgi:hypothetical protein
LPAAFTVSAGNARIVTGKCQDIGWRTDVWNGEGSWKLS